MLGIFSMQSRVGALRKTVVSPDVKSGNRQISHFPVWEQQDIYNEVFDAFINASREGFANRVQICLSKNMIPDINRVYNFHNNDGHTALYIAAVNGNSEVVEVLLERPDLDINRRYQAQNALSRTVLWAAKDKNHLHVVQLLLEHPKTNITEGLLDEELLKNDTIAELTFDEDIYAEEKYEMDDYLCQLLHVASMLGNLTTVTEIVHFNYSVINCLDRYHRTPLFWASTRGHTQVAELLLNDTQTQVNIRKSTTGGTALYQAAKYGHYEIIALLLKHPHTDVNSGLITSETPLFIAAENGHKLGVRLLLTHSSIDVNRGTKSPLMAVSLKGNSEIVKQLLDMVNIDVNIAAFDGKTALFYAVKSGVPESVEYLLRCPKTDIKLLDDAYLSAFDYLKMSSNGENQTQMGNLFDARGDMQRSIGHTCCSKYANRGMFSAINIKDSTWLNKFGRCPELDLNARNELGYTALNLAVQKNLKEIVITLLEDQRIDVNKENAGQRQNAILIASELRHMDIFKRILRHPQTFVNKMDLRGLSAFSLALKNYDGLDHNSFRVIKLLLRCPKVELPKSAKNKNITYDDQKFPMLSINGDTNPTCCQNVQQVILQKAWAGDFRAVRGLIQCPGTQSNINNADEKGRTPLFIASMLGHLEAVKVLLDNEKVNVDIVAKAGTPFSAASERNHREIMKAIIAHGKVEVGRGWARDEWTPYASVNLNNSIQQDEMPIVETEDSANASGNCADILSFNKATG